MLSSNLTTPAESDGRTLGRRAFLTTTLAATAGAAYLTSAQRAEAAPLTPGDINILQFLLAAETLETDLWEQYSELASNNPMFVQALRLIDPTLPDYVNGDFADEKSHAAFISAYLTSQGVVPVSLEPFRTLPGSTARGSSNKLRLTNLSSLTVDTTYYSRYRGDFNPDFNDMPQEVATIKNQLTIPRSDQDTRDPRSLLTIAQSAAFHFGMIEQGGSSLYTALLGKVSDPAAFAILASIGPTEVWHFSLFMSALEGIRPFQISSSLAFPNIVGNPSRGKVTPHPTSFFAASGLPLTSVIRPSSIAKAGAVATVTSLSNSGLFKGQSDAFVAAATTLAMNADAATRNF